MKFHPGDKVFYRLTKREYIIIDSYVIKHDDLRLELIDIKPIKKSLTDKFRLFKGYNSEYFDLITEKSNKENKNLNK